MLNKENEMKHKISKKDEVDVKKKTQKNNFVQ